MWTRKKYSSLQRFVIQKSTSCPDDWKNVECRAAICLPAAGLFVRSVDELLRWSNVDGRFPGPSVVAAAPTPGRRLDDEAGKARKPADSEGE